MPPQRSRRWSGHTDIVWCVAGGLEDLVALLGETEVCQLDHGVVRRVREEQVLRLREWNRATATLLLHT